MSWLQILQSVVTALVIAGIFAAFRLFRDVDQLKTALKYDIEGVKKEIKPVVDWYIKTSMDALKIATNRSPSPYGNGFSITALTTV